MDAADQPRMKIPVTALNRLLFAANFAKKITHEKDKINQNRIMLMMQNQH